MAWQLGGEEISSVNFCRHRVVKCGKKYRPLLRERRGGCGCCNDVVVFGGLEEGGAATSATAAARTIPPCLPPSFRPQVAPLHFRFTSPFRKSLSVPPSIPSSHPSTIFIDGCIRHKGGRGTADTDVDGPSQSSGRGWRKAKRQKSPYIGSCPASRPSSPDLDRDSRGWDDDLTDGWADKAP